MKRAFTVLEVVVALAVLTVSLLVLIDNQATSVLMTSEAERLLVATQLAREKMAEVQLLVETEGFGDQDLEEEGDFRAWADAFEGVNVAADAFEDYRYAWTVREIDLGVVADLAGAAEDIAGTGYWGEEGSQADFGGAPDLSALGVQPEMITDMLGKFIREVRVVVWWGENEDEVDQVELVTHVINPSGQVIPGAGLPQ